MKEKPVSENKKPELVLAEEEAREKSLHDLLAPRRAHNEEIRRELQVISRQLHCRLCGQNTYDARRQEMENARRCSYTPALSTVAAWLAGFCSMACQMNNAQLRLELHDAWREL